MQERGEVCLAEEVERLRKLGLSDEEVASRLGVDAGWVETLVSPGDDEVTPDKVSGHRPQASAGSEA
jgi:transposase